MLTDYLFDYAEQVDIVEFVRARPAHPVEKIVEDWFARVRAESPHEFESATPLEEKQLRLRMDGFVRTAQEF